MSDLKPWIPSKKAVEAAISELLVTEDGQQVITKSVRKALTVAAKLDGVSK